MLVRNILIEGKIDGFHTFMNYLLHLYTLGLNWRECDSFRI